MRTKRDKLKENISLCTNKTLPQQKFKIDNNQSLFLDKSYILFFAHDLQVYEPKMSYEI